MARPALRHIDKPTGLHLPQFAISSGVGTGLDVREGGQVNIQFPMYCAPGIILGDRGPVTQ